MSDPAQFESALDRLADALKDVFRELHSTVPAAVVASPAPVAVPVPAHAAGAGTAPLCTGFGRVLAAANQTDVMQALLDSAASYTGRGAILVVKGERLVPWRWVGFDDAAQAGLRTLNLTSDGDAGWRSAVNAVGSIPASAASPFFEAVGAPGDGRAYLIPLTVRERPVAVIYGDAGSSGNVDAGALRLLTRTAGLRLEILSGGVAKAAAPAAAPVPAPAPAPVVSAPAAPEPSPAPAVVLPQPEPAPEPAPAPAAAPAPRKVAGPDLTNVPAEDQESHKKAFRFAKLLVDELMLYNKDKVALGKQKRDVYSLLQEDIDKSRLAYEKKFANTPAAKVDYFHQQMVQQIGDGDATAIGSGYPGPLV
jgi:hypothetical protein